MCELNEQPCYSIYTMLRWLCGAVAQWSEHLQLKQEPMGLISGSCLGSVVLQYSSAAINMHRHESKSRIHPYQAKPKLSCPSSIHMCMHQSVTVPLSLCFSITISFDYTASFVMTFFKILKYLLERNFMEYTSSYKTHAPPPPQYQQVFCFFQLWVSLTLETWQYTCKPTFLEVVDGRLSRQRFRLGGGGLQFSIFKVQETVLHKKIGDVGCHGNGTVVFKSEALYGDAYKAGARTTL